MKNKRGWIRIVEAMVAILLIAGFLVIVLDNSRNGDSNISKKVYVTENAILREIQLNDTYRDYILSVDNSVEFESFNLNLKEHINSRIPNYLNCTSKICDYEYDSVCDIDSSEENIYARSVMIAVNSDEYNPKILKIFCWTF